MWKQQQQQQATVAGDCEPDVESCRSDVATSSTSATEDDCSPDVQRLHDELVASKLREAEAHLSMKEFEQKLVQLQRHWQVSVVVLTRQTFVWQDTKFAFSPVVTARCDA